MHRPFHLTSGPRPAALALAAIAWAIAGAASAGQLIVPKLPKLPKLSEPPKSLPATAVTFRGVGTAQLQAQHKLLAAPRALDPGTKTKVMGGSIPPGPGNVYVKLTAAQAVVPDRGVLFFYCPMFVDPQAGSATFLNQSTAPLGSALAINLRSPAGRRYLLDCAVSSPAPFNEPQNVKYIIKGPGDVTQTVDIKGPGHLLFILEAQTDGWYQFTIMGTGSLWSFSGCEVTVMP